MEHKKEILEELNLMPVVAGISNNNVYSVDSAYFDTLPDKIIERAQYATFNKNVAYTVPEGYFQSLPQAILQKIKQNEISTELEETAPLLNTISKLNIYTVPDKYFSNFAIAVPKVRHTKVIEIHTVKRMHFSWKYAIAACAVGLILLAGGYLLNNNKKSSEEKFYSSLKKIDVQKAISAVSDSDLAVYLTDPPAEIDYDDNDIAATTASLPEDPSDVQSFLKGMSEKDLDSFLDSDIIVN
ncbi:MAG: hypothetical protein LBE82_09160 [Chitinophagaceae bacterium]|jgi:hypothetical protein|nr:hypothetical protein [Chitinophagaceae bacterium]